MHIKTYRTHQITTKDSLVQVIDAYVPKLKEQSILVITSKIISLCEGSIVSKEEIESKKVLVQELADAYLNDENEKTNPYSIQLTIKNHMLIPSACIDESNGNGTYVLCPKNTQQSAIFIWEHIRNRDKIQELGILITDSYPLPMRRGVIGISLGWCGFKPLYNYIGKHDCFGAPLHVTMRNNLDGLAAAAVFCMGEGNEQTPFAVMTNAPKIEFQLEPPVDAEIQERSIPIHEDLYAPLLKNTNWIFKNQHTNFNLKKGPK
ncbi:MAG: coenzyme F420-0:L-glutamate ligase [Chlamydiales bacterium]|jgi:putative folate metabolism gamma-glutamate ligase|nr:coenzyme F420-0:L-glutamate ligase [Chlamydiales bacterium]